MLEDQLLAIGRLYVARLLLVKQLPLEGRNSGVRSCRSSGGENKHARLESAAECNHQQGGNPLNHSATPVIPDSCLLPPKSRLWSS